MTQETSTSAADQNEIALLANGAKLAFENAESLYHEAGILFHAGKRPRVLLLHQISLEECGKVDIIIATAAEVMSGHTLDVKRLRATLSQHATKNHANSYFLEQSEAEVEARARKDTTAAMKAFNKLQTDFHANSNYLKNASLYVDLANNNFISPSEIITDELIFEIKERNEKFLSYAYQKSAMLEKWSNDRELWAERLTKLGEWITGAKSSGLSVYELLDQFITNSKENSPGSPADTLRKD